MNYDFLLVLLILSSILFGCYRGTLKELHQLVSLLLPFLVLILFGKKLTLSIVGLSFYKNLMYYLEISLGKWFSLRNEFLEIIILYLFVFIILYLLVYFSLYPFLKKNVQTQSNEHHKENKSRLIGSILGFVTSYLVIGVVLVLMNIFIPIDSNTIITKGYLVLNPWVKNLVLLAYTGV